MQTLKFKKTVQALNYFAHKEGGKINVMKAAKLVYFSDRAHIRLYGRSITNDSYLAMKNGTVPSAARDIIYKTGFIESEILDYANQYLSKVLGYDFSNLKDVDFTVFSKSDLKILEEIYNNLGSKTEFQLSNYAHDFPEWKRFESDLKSGVGKRFPIDKRDYFEIGSQEEPIAQDPEHLQLSKGFFFEKA